MTRKTTELPWFKFRPDIWMLGDISFEDLAVQGLYINICSTYWHRKGDLTIDQITGRFKNNTELIAKLTDRFFAVDEVGKITIDWLDEQFLEREQISKTNSKNGSEGGRPKGSSNKEKKPVAFKSKSESKAKKSNIEERRVDKNRVEEDKEKKRREFDGRKASFALTLEPFLNKPYSREMLNEFYKYWTEPMANGSFRMRLDLEKTWDISRRLETWAKRDNAFNPKSQPSEKLNVYPGAFGPKKQAQ